MVASASVKQQVIGWVQLAVTLQGCPSSIQNAVLTVGKVKEELAVLSVKLELTEASVRDRVLSQVGADGKPLHKNEKARSVAIAMALSADQRYGELSKEYRTAKGAVILAEAELEYWHAKLASSVALCQLIPRQNDLRNEGAPAAAAAPKKEDKSQRAQKSDGYEKKPLPSRSIGHDPDPEPNF